MILSGLLYACTNLWVSIPCTFDKCLYISSDVVMIVLATPNSLAHWGYLFSALSLSSLPIRFNSSVFYTSEELSRCLANSGSVDDAYRPLVAAIILLFTVVAISSNVFVLGVYVFHWKSSFRSQPFTYFVLNMILSGLLYACTNLWVSIPCTFDKCLYISSDVMMIVLATPNSLAHWGYLFSALSLTTYRFAIFISKSFAEDRIRVKVLLISPWVLTSVLTFGTTAMGCFKRYSRLALAYTFNCSDCDLGLGITYPDVNFYCGQVIPLVMIAAYVFILVSLYRNRKRNVGFHQRQALVDSKLAFQFTVICFAQYLAAFVFFIVPKLSHGHIWSAIVMNTIGTINVSVNPIVLLLFNQQIRGSIRPNVHEVFRRGVKWDGPQPSSQQEDAEMVLRKKRALTIKEHEIKFHERDEEGNVVVPYLISNEFLESDVEMIENVMDDIEQNTCIRFQRHYPSSERGIPLIQFRSNSSRVCFSQDAGYGKLIMLGRNGCIEKRLIYHEILHSLGVHHEHKRPDRDKYVTIYRNNIKEGHQSQFKKLPDADTHDTPYDYNSVMHYRKDEFGKNGAITIETHDPRYQDKIGIRQAPSKFDYLAVCSLYNCKVCVGWNFELWNFGPPEVRFEGFSDPMELY
ncbi:hypothetical protein Q1695_004576 [Nippostrongylus brasiliensis]|nr:hypothetical protein Q1695_004576 [Nippostrongylus brasiliensis]